MKKVFNLIIALSIVIIMAMFVIMTMRKLQQDYWSALNWGSLPVTNTINDPNNSK